MRSAPSFRAQVPATILLVDDNLDGTVARSSVLQELGYTVVTASTGLDALTLTQARQFDLVITDYKMPAMDGLQLISELRKTGFAKPIILLTGFADKLGLSEKVCGADAVLQKSANEVSNLVRAAKRLLTVPKKPAASTKKTAMRRHAASTE